jgi:hypothetical protein
MALVGSDDGGDMIIVMGVAGSRNTLRFAQRETWRRRQIAERMLRR